jgi:hypothetical protein
VIAAIVTPIALYPLSKTLWAAIDLIMHPQEPHEWADAVNYLESQRGD